LKRLIPFWLLLLTILFPACAPSPNYPSAEPQDNNRGLERGGWFNRYFQYNGTFNYYVGFDLQQLHADTNIDYKDKLDFLAGFGVNKVRIWLFPSWFGLPGEKNYPTTGRILYPWHVDTVSNKFDISKWDPEFWERTKDFLAYAKEKNFVVEVSLFSVQEPRNFFRDPGISYPFHYQNNIQHFGWPTDDDGRFMHGFYEIEYAEGDLKLADFHKAYIDKVLKEFRDFDHIYYELINESPGPALWVNKNLPHDWMKYWMSYISSKTDRIVTTHNNGFMNMRNDNEKGRTSEGYNIVGQRYWDARYFDGFNFHLYSTNPDHISMALTGYQLKGKLLICNEGDTYYDFDRSQGYPNFSLTFSEERLYGEIRHAWGMMTAGGYYSIYYGPVPQLGDESAIAGAKAMQALRHIVEMTEFQNLRPVRANGVEYDDLVTQGPAADWQVIAEEGVNYIVYLWGAKSATDLSIRLSAGNYHYFWMDPRSRKSPLKTGKVALSQSGSIDISPPLASTWNSSAGIVLVIRKASNNRRIQASRVPRVRELDQANKQDLNVALFETNLIQHHH